MYTFVLHEVFFMHLDSERLSAKVSRDNEAGGTDDKSADAEAETHSVSEDSKPATRKSYTVSRSKRRKADKLDNGQYPCFSRFPAALVLGIRLESVAY